MSQWKASGAAPPTGTQHSSCVFKVFGFLTADLAQLFDLAQGDSWVERSQGAEVRNKITDICLFVCFLSWIPEAEAAAELCHRRSPW